MDREDVCLDDDTDSESNNISNDDDSGTNHDNSTNDSDDDDDDGGVWGLVPQRPAHIKESDVQLDHLSSPGVVMPRSPAGLPAGLLHMASPSQLSP